MASVSTSQHREFWMKRAMSFLGLFPLGMYVVCHLWTNLHSLSGSYSFNSVLAETRKHPLFFILELLLFFSILFHTVAGFMLMKKYRPVTSKTPFLGNATFALQRLSGIGLLLFLGAHITKTRILPLVKGLSTVGFEEFHEAFSSPIPLTLIVYFLGILAVSFHLANGLYSFCITWGITTTPKSQKRLRWVSITCFAILLLLFCIAIYGFVANVPTSSTDSWI